MPYKSRKQQRFFNYMASKSQSFKKLANRFNKETYKGKGGSKANKRKYSKLPMRAKKKKS